jgi:hypothetical protein
MFNFFENENLKKSNMICHTGGAVGSDTYFEKYGEEYGIMIKAYSYKTPIHNSSNKVEISEEDFREGIIQIQKANRTLNRYGISKYMNLLARNWCQVKYSEEVFAIGDIVEPNKKGNKGFYNKSKYQVVDGGTGYACVMCINNTKPLYVFDQEKDKWFRWSYTSLKFIDIKEPKINYNNFTGIGTRKIKENGIKAINDLYKRTFDLL